MKKSYLVLRAVFDVDLPIELEVLFLFQLAAFALLEFDLGLERGLGCHHCQDRRRNLEKMLMVCRGGRSRNQSAVLMWSDCMALLWLRPKEPVGERADAPSRCETSQVREMKKRNQESLGNDQPLWMKRMLFFSVVFLNGQEGNDGLCPRAGY
jgi:hypothetical protein